MEGQSSEQDGAPKKPSPFDNMTRDDLVKKCKGLLGIAQKAKQAKDECLEENRKLKEELNNYETQKSADKDCLKTMQEFVDSLTEQKLKFTTTISDLERRTKDFDQLAIENEAFRRQVKRLTDENEDLLGDLSSLEKKYDECNRSATENHDEGIEKMKLEAEVKELKAREEKLIRKLKLYKNKVQEISAKLMLLKSDRQILIKTVKEYSQTVPKWQNELKNASQLLFQKIAAYEKDSKGMLSKISNYEAELSKIQGFNEQLNNDLMAAKSADCSKFLNEEIAKLTESLGTKDEEMNNVISKYESIKHENIELLSELKEINEIIKERGGVISLQLSRISDLELQNNDFQAKLNENLQNSSEEFEKLRKINQEYEENLRILQNKIEEKESELQNFREKFNTNFGDTQSEIMSTSTISRADESMRMREIEDCYEEKYNKLRSLAVKLKKKVADQTIYIQKLEKDGVTNKNLQSLQTEYDKLMDELESSKKVGEELQQKVTMLEKEVGDVDMGKKDKSSLEIALKEHQAQIQSLKKEKEALTTADEENVKLRTTLAETLEAQKVLKSELDKTKLAVKKTNVLSLEMEAYEKSLNEINKKLLAKKSLVAEMEGTIEAHENTIKSLKNQIQLLEESLDAEKNHGKDMKHQMDIQQNKLRESEHEKSCISIELDQLKREHERMKLEMEANRLELEDSVSEREKACGILDSEKNKLVKQVFNMEDEASTLKTMIKEKEQEMEDVKTEFASYKIRAQSVLRQNQNKDSGREKELEDEINTLHKTIDSKESKHSAISQQLNDLTKHFEELQEDKLRIQTRCKDLLDLLEETRIQNENLLDDTRRLNLEHQEALKTQRLQSETLINCYKKQISEVEEKYSKEIENIQTKLNESNNNEGFRPIDTRMTGSGQQITDEQKINLILMEREEGEGSESTTSQTSYPMRRKISATNSQKMRTRELIPLDELLNSSFDDNPVFDVEDRPRSMSPTIELHQTKDKLVVQESRVKHLAALLAEAEQDLAKLTQLNDVLKEEVRRQQRSIDREQHVQNSEYLKNVVFKFLTLNSGDEKTHLVPVLNTILKLSPDETNKLLSFAKGGDASGRGWSGYLPLWSNNN